MRYCPRYSRRSVLGILSGVSSVYSHLCPSEDGWLSSLELLGMLLMSLLKSRWRCFYLSVLIEKKLLLNNDLAELLLSMLLVRR